MSQPLQGLPATWATISIYCLGCGAKSPSQALPTPLCPFCAVEPRMQSYVAQFVEAWLSEENLKLLAEQRGMRLIKFNPSNPEAMLNRDDLVPEGK